MIWRSYIHQKVQKYQKNRCDTDQRKFHNFGKKCLKVKILLSNIKNNSKLSKYLKFDWKSTKPKMRKKSVKTIFYLIEAFIKYKNCKIDFFVQNWKNFCSNINRKEKKAKKTAFLAKNGHFWVFWWFFGQFFK